MQELLYSIPKWKNSVNQMEGKYRYQIDSTSFCVSDATYL